ncbi:unnamed protein product, partial [marine sediment metagenome]
IRLNCSINMAYDKKVIYKKALQVVERDGVYFLSDVIALVGIASSTWYQLFPTDSSETVTIKERMIEKRVDAKSTVLRNWKESDNATLQMGFMKIIANESQFDRLNGTKQKIEHSGEITISPKEWID